MKRGRIILSSTPLEIMFTINRFYLGFFFIAEILLIIYKTQVLFYPSNNLALDLVLLFFLLVLEMIRLFVGSSGNLTEQAFSSIIAIVLLLGNAVIVFYFIFWQTFVLRLDVVLCAIMFAFHGLELLFGILAITSFAKSKNAP